MVNITVRKSKNSLTLYLRVKNHEGDTSYSLGIDVSDSRWETIKRELHEARKASKRHSTVFLDDSVTSSLWSLLKAVTAMNMAGIARYDDIQIAIREHLYPEQVDAYVRNYEKGSKIAPLDFFRSIVNDMRKGNILHKNNTSKLSYKTIELFSIVVDNLTKYDHALLRHLTWDDMNMNTFNDFKMFLVRRGLKNNTLSIYMGKLKTLMGIAKDRHLTTNDDFLLHGYGVSMSQVDGVYVTYERIDELYHTDFHRNTLNTARDIFVIGCDTGQRYSDIIHMDTSMIVTLNDKQFIHIIQKKTLKEIYVPVTSRVWQILSHHNGKVPFMYLGAYNRYLRGIGCLMGWDEYVPAMKKKFYECLSSHTARRSFATNAYKRNVPISAIMAVTGHSSETILKRYLKMNSQELAVMASQYFR